MDDNEKDPVPLGELRRMVRERMEAKAKLAREKAKEKARQKRKRLAAVRKNTMKKFFGNTKKGETENAQNA